MRLDLWCLLFSTLQSRLVKASVSKNSMDKLGYHDYSDIVRDLIKNWESPIVYLRQLGYLPSDYQDTSKIKPNLDALMSRIEQNDQLSIQADENKSKELKLKTKRASLAKLIKYRQHRREATASQNVNYPNVDQLMKMAHQYRKLLPQHQQPVEEQNNAKLNANVEMLQRMVERTSPHAQPLQTKFASGPVESVPFAVVPQSPMNPAAMLQLLSSNSVKPTTMLANGLNGVSGSGDNSAMSMYGTISKSNVNNDNHSPQFSRQNGAQSSSNVQPDIEAPQYLNWDITNKRLKQISPYAKDAYVDKLVQIYVKKQQTLDILHSKQKDDIFGR